MSEYKEIYCLHEIIEILNNLIRLAINQRDLSEKAFDPKPTPEDIEGYFRSKGNAEALLLAVGLIENYIKSTDYQDAE